MATTMPITFEAMRRAKKESEGIAEVRLLSAQFPEDREIVPDEFEAAPDLLRSTHDVPGLAGGPKLPLLSDILQRAYDATNQGFIIFSNCDIIPRGDFYLKCAGWIASGLDAFIINRRRLPPDCDSPEHLLSILAESGLSHPGFDCFVFRRDLIPKMQLAGIVTGVPFSEIVLSQNLFALSDQFRLFRKQFLTRHIGLEIFRKRSPEDCYKFNRTEYQKAMNSLSGEMDSGRLPFAHRILPHRILTWALHPCFPVRLCLKLEFGNHPNSNGKSVRFNRLRID